MDSSVFDYIIVGQGLAGSAVSIQLLKRNKRILVFDQPHLNTSSRIAAGLFNPITGKKLVRTWKADALFPYLHKFYQEVEIQTNSQFFYTLPIYRPFLSVEEQNEWMAKSSDPELMPFIEKIFLKKAYDKVQDPLGGLLLKQSGFLDTRVYVDAVRDLIRKEGKLIEDHFDDHKLEVSDDRVKYDHYTASHIIFCQGTHSGKWFGWLPVHPLKGETIRVNADADPDVILNRGVYMVPAGGNGQWRVGATYNFQDRQADITTKARMELEVKLSELLTGSFETQGQEWGFRPTTPDRRPLLGTHPDADRVSVFNGLGTKGVSLSPYFSEVLIRCIENDMPLDNAVDIERYKSLYWTSPK